MRSAIATQSAPGHDNEDFAAATARGAVLLDGAGMAGVDDGGCIHGVAWYVHTLGGALISGLARSADADLTQLLGDAIEQTADSHRGTCDLGHPGTPSSTVVMVHNRAGSLRYLVLADSVLLIDCGDDLQVITDDREAVVGRQFRQQMDALPGRSAEHGEALASYVQALREYRNRPGGFWVAAASPDAAAQALTGTRDATGVSSATLLSDGASRLTDRFTLASWRELVSIVATTGGQALIDAVRAAEGRDPEGLRWPRGKIHDDASVAYCDQLG